MDSPASPRSWFLETPEGQPMVQSSQADHQETVGANRVLGRGRTLWSRMGRASLAGSLPPVQGSRPTQQGSEPGVGWEALPAARYSQGLHCVAAAVGSRWLPDPTRGGPAASRASGGGHDGPSRVGAWVSWARSGHSQHTARHAEQRCVCFCPSSCSTVLR